MLFGFDAIVASLVFVLPGFLVVGTIVALVPSWERFNPNPATYVLLSLGASVPLHLLFAWLSSFSWLPRVEPWFKAFDTFDFTKLTSLAFTVSFLKPLLAPLLVSAAVGLGIVGAMHLWKLVATKASATATISRKSVWRQRFESRKMAPFVVIIVGERAYLGQPTSVTTSDTDPHVFLESVEVMPVDGSSRNPDWAKRTSLNMEGILVHRDEIREMWFLNNMGPQETSGEA